MSDDLSAFERQWQRPAVVVPADFRGLLAFRQFKLTAADDFFYPVSSIKTSRKFEDDFTLRSIFQQENWRPTGNKAHCNSVRAPHPVPALDCRCGYYASYSSTIIYQSNLLKSALHCFGAVRMYGENLPLAQNGLRSSGADVAGILFNPASRELPAVQLFMLRLQTEGIYFTFSAQEFIQHFPDQSYTDILGFDPVERLANTRHKFILSRGIYESGAWQSVDYSHRFCRPIRAEEMLLRSELPAESTPSQVAYEVYLKPEYCPGGSLYKHPLLEIWDS